MIYAPSLARSTPLIGRKRDVKTRLLQPFYRARSFLVIRAPWSV